MHQIPHAAWRISPIPVSHNWQSMKASKRAWAVDNLLAPAKTWAFRCSYCGKMGQKEGQDTFPAAVHTGHHDRAIVKFDSRADEAKTYGSEKNSDHLIVSQHPDIGIKITLIKDFVCACIKSSSLCINTGWGWGGDGVLLIRQWQWGSSFCFIETYNLMDNYDLADSAFNFFLL